MIAKSYARIGWQNLVNFGILPLEFVDSENYNRIARADELEFFGLHQALKEGKNIQIINNHNKK